MYIGLLAAMMMMMTKIPEVEFHRLNHLLGSDCHQEFYCLTKISYSFERNCRYGKKSSSYR